MYKRYNVGDVVTVNIPNHPYNGMLAEVFSYGKIGCPTTGWSYCVLLENGVTAFYSSSSLTNFEEEIV